MQKIKKNRLLGNMPVAITVSYFVFIVLKILFGHAGRKRKPFTLKRGGHPYIRHFSVDGKEMPDINAEM
jgi:hypothetical protein